MLRWQLLLAASFSDGGQCLLIDSLFGIGPVPEMRYPDLRPSQLNGNRGERGRQLIMIGLTLTEPRVHELTVGLEAAPASTD
ncbi:hypothetical protein ASPWEDRAFT_251224 [Aspergillus wentii DTO 134E9]|uniref:Uncharacterized protein n=1 Tax=Aspergillus wentii DTO 134E9 TaxID=1073089 RepID=A0A1L9S207_ASPWE|nr:uncharacterized protein ASPWEDRAFT_251224 [Aspergillus wentii DTO 134E9]OJJ41194.1 hypothetical protein ASPWEDRAFT_251224 [Aspergillus wentii DTO 134E9]